MGFSLETSIPVLTVFVQGLLSFFSPCVLPLIPLYIGYLAGGTGRVREDGVVEYPRKNVLVNTLFFVVGISFAFFLLGFGFTALGRFFTGNQRLFSVIAGIIMCAFGLYMLGAFGKAHAIETERRLPFNLGKFAMNPLVALALGFTFSFAWTPCVGPVLTSVLLMASSSAQAAAGYMLVGVYTLGFVLPFLAVGLFTGEVLRFFRTHGNVVKYTVKVGGALLIVMGLMTVTGWMNGVTGYLSSATTTSVAQQPTNTGSNDIDGSQAKDDTDGGNESENAKQKLPPDSNSSEDKDAAQPAAPKAETVLLDQNGAEHRLSDYRGKTVFLNFFATWCGPCRREIPDIERVYHDRGENKGDVIVLGVANPKSDGHPRSNDASIEEVKSFIGEQGITYPVLMDTTGELFNAFAVGAFPTTYMIDRDGRVFGYISGSLTLDMMNSIIDQTVAGERK